jgi:NAD(P)-dependent dehydrogenase (short-subunit alcohol dehydrogenase family)
MASKLFAVVAGAGPGTGRATALRFAKTYPVVLMARRPESYRETVAEINQAGGKAVGVISDVTDPKSVESAFKTIWKELPGLKLAAAVYNVSSGYMIKPFLELKPEDLDNSLSGSALVLYFPLAPF